MPVRLSDGMLVRPLDSKFKLALQIASGLLVSGVIHLGWWGISGQPWEGPLSLRKPALFGISAGLTILSLVWVVSKLSPRPGDRWFVNGLSTLLLLEVGLITVQCWRGVPSHFNRATPGDALVEAAMFALIAAVTAGIGWLCWRSVKLPDFDRADQLALRAGLWFLLLGCLLGFVTTWLGDANLAAGKSPEVWRSAGVLKFPHGAALHAIQLFPFLSWCARHAGTARPIRVVWAAIFSQATFLVYAIRQAAYGRSRFDADGIGWTLLAISMALATLAVLDILAALVRQYCSRTTAPAAAIEPSGTALPRNSHAP